MKNLVSKVVNFVKNREPVALISLVSGALTTFVVEAQGDLHGQDAWVAVGWAVATLLARQAVTPAGKVNEQDSSTQAVIDFIQNYEKED